VRQVPSTQAFRQRVGWEKRRWVLGNTDLDKIFLDPTTIWISGCEGCCATQDDAHVCDGELGWWGVLPKTEQW